MEFFSFFFLFFSFLFFSSLFNFLILLKWQSSISIFSKKFVIFKI